MENIFSSNLIFNVFFKNSSILPFFNRICHFTFDDSYLKTANSKSIKAIHLLFDLVVGASLVTALYFELKRQPVALLDDDSSDADSVTSDDDSVTSDLSSVSASSTYSHDVPVIENVEVIDTRGQAPLPQVLYSLQEIRQKLVSFADDMQKIHQPASRLIYSISMLTYLIHIKPVWNRVWKEITRTQALPLLSKSRL